MSRPEPFSAAEAARQIDHTRRRIEADQARFSVLAFPLALFGVISCVAAGVQLAYGDQTYGTFWAFAGPSGGIAIGLWSWRTEQRWPFTRPHAVAMATTALGLVVGAWVAGTGGAVQAPFFAVGSAYVLFAAFTDSRPTFWAAVAILATTWASYLGAPGIDGLAALTASTGVIQLAAAAAELGIGRARVAAALAG